jgi:hypothetical protein
MNKAKMGLVENGTGREMLGAGTDVFSLVASSPRWAMRIQALWAKARPRLNAIHF